jgi:glycosyltransferase involved in cell wall biosynthesis
MRVLHVYSGNLFGGIEAILVALARHRSLADVSHEFALSFHGRLERELSATGAAIHHLGPARVSRPASVRAARAALAALVGSSNFDRVICHAPWSQAIFGGVVRRAPAPLVFWAHDVMTGRHWTERLARRVVPDLAICNSRFTAGTLGSLYPAAPHAIVYAPVETSRLPPDAEHRRRVRRTLATPDDAVVIVQASRSERWKGHAVLLEALSHLHGVPRWVWWQVGGAQRPAETAFLASLKQLAGRFGLEDRVRWVGERDDVPALLAAADVYCQANVEPEPFGVAFVEALGAGLPVVTSEIGGACEVVDRSCGVLVQPRDPLALAAALRLLIDDAPRRARLSEAAPARARQLCDPSSQLQRLASVLHEMAPAEVGA